MTMPLSSRLAGSRATIQQICDISGVPGVSIGILHQGEIVHTDNFGFRDIARQLPPTSSTRYGIGSITKSFVAAGIGQLVHEGRLGWDTPVKDVLSDFRPKNQCLRELATVTDLLSHRTGLSNSVMLSFQGDGEALLPADQLMPMVNNMHNIQPFRSRWQYNSWGYSIAGLMIERLSNRTLEDFLQTKLLKPLHMDRTTTHVDFIHDDNVAEAYAALSNGSVHHLKHRQVFEHTVFEAAAGIYSSVDDLLRWAAALLESQHASKMHGPVLIAQAKTLLSGQIPIFNPSLRERSCALGWIRTQLPGPVGLIGDNEAILPFEDLPELGSGAIPQLIVYHQGSTVGYFSAVSLLPETHSAIIVLTNSMALNDAADWISQVLVQALLDPPKPNNYVLKAEESRSTLLSRYSHMKNEIEKLRRHGTMPRPLREYTGNYVNELGNFALEISIHPRHEDTLSLAFQGRDTQRYELRHSNEDVFEWSLSADEVAQRGRYHEWNIVFYMISFHFNNLTTTKNISWVDNPDTEPEGQIYVARLQPGFETNTQSN